MNHQQVRAYLALSKYDFVINHWPGVTNPADGPSRRLDYISEAQKPSQKYNQDFVQPMRQILGRTSDSTVQINSVTTRLRDKALKGALHEYWKNLQLTRKGYPTEQEVEDNTTETDSSAKEAKVQPKTGQSDPEPHSMTQDGRILLQSDADKEVAIQAAHYNPLAGHFGFQKTIKKVSRHYYWKGITKDIADYCNDCLRCRMSAAAKHKPYGKLAPLPPPERPWQEVTFDFITDLPPSRVSGLAYDSIMVIVCRLTKMAHYVPAQKDWKGIDLAQSWIREVVRLHGVPERIISDRGPLMNAKHWNTFNYYLNSKRILTLAYHLETDGQTERQNQTLEQYLRVYCSLEQDDWALWISVAEFAYNDSKHATTGNTPFQANYGMDPRSANWPKLPQSGGKSEMAYEVASKVINIQQECRAKIEAANQYQKVYADKKRLEALFKVGDKVLLSTKHVKSLQPKKKLDWKDMGPGTVTAQIGPSAFKINMPGLKNVHPVFHASLLEPFEKRGQLQHPNEPIQDTLRTHGDDVYEVD